MLFLIEHRTLGRRPCLMTKLLVMFVALFYGFMSHASIVSTSHAPANWSGHDNAPLLAAQSGDHDHSHDDPQTGDRSAGHQHGNHATDHSHDKSNLPRSDDTHAAMKLPDIWGTAPRTPAYPEPCFSFERPPKFPLMS
ncbi:MAG: hypothetical protein Q8K18_18790 [Burkholderiales bacterium]|nr:hypothetical protein [Burkholderiales bacterium]